MSRADDRASSTRSRILFTLQVNSENKFELVHEKMVCARPRALSELECVVRK